MSKEVLWVRNDSGSDVSLSDLGVKVPRGKTINLFQHNPYLTVDKVKKSLENGSLAKRVSSGVLTQVQGPSNSRPASLDHVKQSDESVTVKKTKTSVVVESSTPELEDEQYQEGFSFADYGIDDLGDVTQEKKGAAVVVSATQDDAPEAPAKTEAKPVKTDNPISKQSVVTMQEQQEAMSHPMGKVAQTSNKVGATQPFVVTKPLANENEPDLQQVEKQEIKPSIEGNVVTPQKGTVVADRDPEVIQELRRRAEELGVALEELPESTVIEVEAQVIGDKVIKDDAKKTFDSQVATKTEEGATIMKFREVDKKDDS